MNSHIPPARRSHHSLPKDIRCMQSREGYYSHMLPLHNGHRSLPRDGHYSALPDNGLVHMGQYQHPASYISSQPSYPDSLSCPSLSVLSRQSSSRASSHAPLAKSNGRAEGYNFALGSHAVTTLDGVYFWMVLLISESWKILIRQTFTCSKSNMFKFKQKTPAASLLLTLNMFHSFSYCFFCWLWTSCLLDSMERSYFWIFEFEEKLSNLTCFLKT